MKKINRISKTMKKEKAAKLLTAQSSIPFEEIYENAMILVKSTEKSATYAMLFLVDNTDYMLLKDEEKLKKLASYKSVFDSLPNDINYQELLINVPVESEKIIKAVVPEDSACKTEYARAYRNNQLAFVERVRRKSSVCRLFFALSYEVKSQLDNPYNILKQNYQKISERFNEMKSKVYELTAEQTLEVFYNILNPYEIGEFMLPDNMYSRGLNIRDYIAPTGIKFNSKTIEMGAAYTTALFVKGYSQTLDDEFVYELLDNDYKIVVSKQLKHIDKSIAEKIVTDRLKELEADQQTRMERNHKKGTNYIPLGIRKEIEACEEMLGMLNENEELFDIGIYILVSAESEQDLKDIISSIKGVCSRHHISVAQPLLRQEDALTSVLPLADDKLNLRNYLLSSGASMLLPFSYDRRFSQNGFFYGRNTVSGAPIILSRKEDKNGNGFFLGKSGSGKSLFAKMEINDVYHLTEKDKIIVLDPECEFAAQCLFLNGQVIKISASSKNYINPFDLSGNKSEKSIRDKCDLILSLIEEFKSEPLSAEERPIIDRCVLLVYDEYVKSNYVKEKTPTFADFYKILDGQPEKEICKNLKLYLEMYVTGSLDIFSHHTNVDLSNRYVDFDLSDLGSALKTAGMLIILDHIWQSLLDNESKGVYTWLYADEFENFYGESVAKNKSGEFFESVFARFRKHGGMATGITQNVTNVVANPKSLSMLQNSQFVVLLEQAEENNKIVTGLYHLSDKQSSKIQNPDKGEGLLITHNLAIPFEKIYPKNNIVYDAITTDFSELAKKKAKGEELIY